MEISLTKNIFYRIDLELCSRGSVMLASVWFI